MLGFAIALVFRPAEFLGIVVRRLTLGSPSALVRAVWGSSRRVLMQKPLCVLLLWVESSQCLGNYRAGFDLAPPSFLSADLRIAVGSGGDGWILYVCLFALCFLGERSGGFALF